MNAKQPICRTVSVLVAMLIALIARAQDSPNAGNSPNRLLLTPDLTAEDSGSASATSPSKPSLQFALNPGQAAVAKVETVTERYPDGSVKIERQVTQDSAGNYINHGTYTMYNLDGKPLKAGQFQNGKQHGAWVQYLAKDEGYLFSTGQEKEFQGPFASESTFVDGQLHGIWRIKDRNKNNVIEWNFEHGVRDGRWTWWHPNGQKRSEATYTNGALNGEVLEWDRDGKQVSQNTYVNGKCLVKAIGWYAVGQKHFEGYYLRVQNMSEPVYDWWTSSAKAAPAVPAAPDQMHGVWIVWYRNGNKKTEAQYDHDVPVGKFTWWYENGQKQADAEYQAGVKSGTWITWHSNGQKESQGEFKEGTLVSQWMHWDADGKLVEVHDLNTVRSQGVKRMQARTGQRPNETIKGR